VRRPEKRIRVFSGDDYQDVMFRPYILPARHELEATGKHSAEEVFKDLGGPSHWNRQQGFYIYRGDRMIQSGGWCGLRAIDEHTKLARVALDFSPGLDTLFSIDIAKMRVTLPPEVRLSLETPVYELCRGADAKYRAGAPRDGGDLAPGLRTPDLGLVARMLHMAAFRSRNKVAYDEILAVVAASDPDLAGQLGWKDIDGTIRQIS
ncbi:ATP-binding protein, partial [bacterium AH-315-A03]|nr:ATP-binding protein [bacterium AH-315-A03]